jgi:hypothetical protein
MKKFKILLISSVVITFSFLTAGHLYTKILISDIAYRYAERVFNANVFGEGDDGEVIPENTNLSLGRLLQINMGSISSNSNLIYLEGDEVKNKWKELIISDPSLAYTSIDLYSETFKESYTNSFNEIKQEFISRMGEGYSDWEREKLNLAKSLNSEVLMKQNIESMTKYQALIDELLKLDDVTLNRYIKSISKDPCCYWSETDVQVEALELKKWLGSKSFISNSELSAPQLPYHAKFPTDLILLTNRISSNNPKWTNRKFLQEAKKFSLHVQKNLKN